MLQTHNVRDPLKRNTSGKMIQNNCVVFVEMTFL